MRIGRAASADDRDLPGGHWLVLGSGVIGLFVGAGAVVLVLGFSPLMTWLKGSRGEARREDSWPSAR